MKHKVANITLRLSFLVISFCFITNLARADEELLILSHPFPPWQFFNEETQQVEGINIDIAKLIFNKLGIKIKFIEQPWASAWNIIKKGQAEAILSASRKQAREKYLWYPQENMWLSEYVFFITKRNKNAKLTGDYYDMQNTNARIGIVNGYSYHKSFWTAFPFQDLTTYYQTDKRDYHAQIYGVRTPEKLFKMLIANRVDVVINDKSIGLYLIKKLNMQEQLSYYDTTLFSKGYPMPFAKMSKYPGLKKIAKQYEIELRELKQTGVYQKIIAKWLY